MRCRSRVSLLLAAALGSQAATSGETLSGRYLVRPATAIEFTVHNDRFDYDRAGSMVRQFPGVRLDLLQDGNRLLPSPAGIIDSGHRAWEIAVQPGRVWDDGTGPQAALPFALLERNANCTHNGVLRWAADDPAGGLHFEIGNETCAYFQFDMAGRAAMERQGNTAFPASLKNAIDRQRAARLPVYPIAAIANDFDGVDAGAFGAVGDMRAEHMSVYGVVIDGRHYRGGCETRFGSYLFCDELLLPSYSTAKSLVGGLAMMHLERLSPGASQQTISTLVDACRAWNGITIEHALDMATGRYEKTGPEVDEATPRHVRFLYADTHKARIEAACTLFKKREAPGRTFVYHSSDTYVAGAAMQNYLQELYGPAADLFRDLLERPVFDPLALSPIARQTRRSYDAARQPLTGWGLTLIPDDYARLGHWLNSGATVNGFSIPDPAMFNAAMQRDPHDRGLPADGDTFRYNNGFWAHDIAAYIGCKRSVWVPFMSGYGGISVVLFPNGVTYYYVSDGYTQRWREAAVAINKVRNMCA